MVCLSKSLSGLGLPMAITLIRPDLDIWEPGEHNGTFRGNNTAFVTATAALESYWRTDALTTEVERKTETVRSYLEKLVFEFPAARGQVRGRGLLQGLFCDVPGLAQEVSRVAFERGLIVETSGPESDVIKVLPPLNIDDTSLLIGLYILRESLSETLGAGDWSAEPELVAVGVGR
jgi:diaminobutyrate-2-oxoglutarate transaminase